MKSVSNRFKDEIKKYGRQIDVIIRYNINGKEYLLDSDSLISIVPQVNGNILESVMKLLEFETTQFIPKNTIISVKFGTLVDNALTVEEVDNMQLERLEQFLMGYLSDELKEFEYINLGNYIIRDEPEYNADTNSYSYVCNDKMLYAMKNYEDLDITYPITIREYINKIAEHIGLKFKNKNDTFANYNKQIKSELYDEKYTFRDVLDELAQVTASTICINEQTDELEIRYITETNDKIDEDYLKDINVEFGEKYGPINSIVLSRSAESDNVFLQDEESVSTNGLCELKIIDNQIMNDNDRSDFLPDILNKLNGLQYYINDFSSPGITWYELCDRYTVKINENLYSCVLFNDEIKITQGLEETIYTEMPKETQTDYTKADKTDRRINQTYMIVDKQNQRIEALVSQTTENTEKLSQHEQTIDSITDTVSSVETKLENDYYTRTETDSKITQKADSITSEVNESISTAKQEAIDSANSSTDNKLKNYTKTVDMNSKIEQTAENITSEVSKNYSTKDETKEAKQEAIDSANTSTDNKLKDYSTTTQMNSAITQKADEITSSVSKTIENIQIGGTNLLNNSAPYNNLDYWNNLGTSSSIVDESSSPSGKAIKVHHQDNSAAGIYNEAKNLEIGKEYSWSLWIKASKPVETLVGHEQNGRKNVNVTTEWQKFTHTFIAQKNNNNYHAFTIYNFETDKTGLDVYIHSLKLEEGNKITAWSPSPEDEVNQIELGTKIEQNWEHVKYAWNKISEFIQMEILNGNASLAFRKDTNNLLMALDKLGQHFYSNGKVFGEMGVKTVDNQNYIAFSVPSDYNKQIADGMAWGITTSSDGKFHPILFIKNFGMGNKQSDDSYGQLALRNCDLVLENIEAGIVAGNVRVYMTAFNQMVFEDTKTGTILLSISPDNQPITNPGIDILGGKIRFFKNVFGTNTLVIGEEGNEKVSISDDSNGVIQCHGYIYCNNGVQPFSLAKLKKNIKKYNNKALNEIKNTDIYYYNYKDDDKKCKKRIGAVIGQKYNCSKEIIGNEGKGIDMYSMISLSYKAIQEQQEVIEQLQEKDKQKNEIIQDLIKRIENLEI